MNTKKKWVITALVFVLFIAAGVAYHFMKKNSLQDGGNAALVPSRTSGTLNINAYVVKEKPLTDNITATGTLIPDEQVNLSFETSGKIVSINFDEGSRVKKGDLLAKVNDKTLQAQLSRYEAQLKLAEARVFRQSALLERDAVSQEAAEQANTELAILNADMALVKANIALTELRAPFDGVIGLRQVSEGAYASPSTVIATLTKLSPIKIEFSVNEQYASQVQAGTNLTFQVQGVLKTFNSSVYAAESQVDADIRSLKVRARYPNTNYELIPGRYINVTIKMLEIPNAIVIPSPALIPEMGMAKVFLYKNGKAEPVNVEIGMRTDAEVQILSGLSVGDTLITSGTLQLRTGMDVVIDKIE